MPHGKEVIVPARIGLAGTMRWFTSIVIDCNAGPTGEGSITIEYVPMTESGILMHTGPNGESLVRRVRTDTLYADKDKVKALDDAFRAFLAAITPMEEYKEAEEKQKAEKVPRVADLPEGAI
jgi:hypothetical protein